MSKRKSYTKNKYEPVTVNIKFEPQEIVKLLLLHHSYSKMNCMKMIMKFFYEFDE